MITASECRELAQSYRDHAPAVGSSQKANLFRNIAHSFSGLATQLEVLEEMYRHDKCVNSNAPERRQAAAPLAGIEWKQPVQP